MASSCDVEGNSLLLPRHRHPPSSVAGLLFGRFTSSDLWGWQTGVADLMSSALDPRIIVRDGLFSGCLLRRLDGASSVTRGRRCRFSSSPLFGLWYFHLFLDHIWGVWQRLEKFHSDQRISSGVGCCPFLSRVGMSCLRFHEPFGQKSLMCASFLVRSVEYGRG